MRMIRNSFNLLINVIFRKEFCISIVIIWGILQVFYINCFHYTELVSDPGSYVYRAIQCIEHGTMYPDYSNYYDRFIFNPGWINFIILWIRIFGSIEYLPYVNVLFNIILVFLIYCICIKLTHSKKTSFLSAYLFMFIPSFFSITLHLYSDLLFCVLSLCSFILVLVKLRYRYGTLVIAGILIALANWIRPMGVAFVIAAIFLLLLKYNDWKGILIYLCSIIGVCFIIGWTSHLNFPDYIYKSTTGGYNLIMNCYKGATGGYTEENFKEGSLGYIPEAYSNENLPVWAIYKQKYCKASGNKYNYRQLDSIYMTRSLNWIKDNPCEYIRTLPLKAMVVRNCPLFFFTYNSSFIHSNNGETMIVSAERNLLMRVSISFWVRFYELIVYIFFIGVILYFWRSIERIYFIIPGLIMWASTIFIVSAPRYNMVYMPFIFIGAAITIANLSKSIFRTIKKQ